MTCKLIVGCGYLGRRVARTWIAQGSRVCALTRTSAGAGQLRDLGVEPITGDVTDLASLPSLPQAECVLYAVGYDRNSGGSRRAVYVDGLSHALRRLSPATGRLIYISSTSVYGQDRGEWIDESSPCRPTRPNGQICLEAEELLRHVSSAGPRTGEIETIVLRLAGIYGPQRLLRPIGALKSGEPLAVNPDAYLNLIHVDDAVSAVLAAELRGQPGEVYLVSDDRPVTRREYYTKLAKLAQAPPPTFSPDAVTDDARRSTGLNKRCRNARMRSELEVELQFPTIDSGLPHAVSESL